MKKKQYGNESKITVVSGIIVTFIIALCFGAIVNGVEKNKISSEIATTGIVIGETEAVTEMETKKDELIVCLDPGHGGSDPGTISGSHYEKKDNMRIVLKIKKRLEKKGIKVILTREDDSLPSLKKRAKIANEADADLFVSLHRNSMAGYPQINGIDIYINCKTTDADRYIGQCLFDELSQVNGMKVNEPKRGSATDTEENYIVVRKSKMTACLIEMGYMSNDNDLNGFDKDIDKYAKAIANGIEQYLSVYGNETK